MGRRDSIGDNFVQYCGYAYVFQDNAQGDTLERIMNTDHMTYRLIRCLQ